MGVQSIPIRLVEGGGVQVLANMLADTVLGGNGTLVGCYLGLFTAWPGYSFTRVLADLTAANYTGYARQLLVFGTQGTDPDERPEVESASLLFSPTDGVTPNTIIGVFLADAVAAGNLLGVGLLPAPVELNDASDDLTVAVKIAIPADADDWGVAAALI